jgi:hypothetical protein
LGLIGLVTLASLGCAALVQPGARWLSVLVTLTALAVIWQSLRAVLQRGPARAAAVGWLVFTIAYLALVMGPWLQSHVGPQLLSTKALVYAQVQWRKEDPGSFVTTVQPVSVWSDISGVVDWNGVVDGTSSTIVSSGGVALFPYPLQVSQPGNVNYFQLSGHWLFAWVAGWLGATIAAHFWRRQSDAVNDKSNAVKA